MHTSTPGDAQPIDHGKLIKWLDEKLADERRTLELFHSSLLEECQSWLTGATLTDVVQVTESFCDSTTPQANEGAKPEDAPAVSKLQVFGSEEPTSPLSVASPQQVQRYRRTSTRNSQLLTKKDSLSSLGWLQRIVLSKRFETFFGAIILVNVVFMALEAQYMGLGVGHRISFPSYDHSKETIWPAADTVFDVADLFFGIMYTIEIVVKLLGLRSAFVWDTWNLLDLSVLVAWYFDKIATMVVLPIDPRLFRILRLCRILRLARLATSLTQFEQLFLMMTALRGSLRMLAWVTLLLLAFLVPVAFVLNQMLLTYLIEQEDVGITKRTTCFLYFGTFSRSVFSMFELTIGNWIPIARFLMDEVNEFFLLFALFYKLTAGFALVAVINGCFIKETFKVADADDHLMIIQKDKEGKMHSDKMLKLLNEADASGDGLLSLEEFEQICANPEIRKWLLAQGVGVVDARELFTLMDTGCSGDLSHEELVTGISALKGNAKQLDLYHERRLAVLREGKILSKLSEIESIVMRTEQETKLMKAHAAQKEGAGLLVRPKGKPSKELANIDLKGINDEVSRLAHEVAATRQDIITQRIPRPEFNGSPVFNAATVVHVRDSPNEKVLVPCGCS